MKFSPALEYAYGIYKRLLNKNELDALEAELQSSIPPALREQGQETKTTGIDRPLDRSRLSSTEPDLPTPG